MFTRTSSPADADVHLSVRELDRLADLALECTQRNSRIAAVGRGGRKVLLHVAPFLGAPLFIAWMVLPTYGFFPYVTDHPFLSALSLAAVWVGLLWVFCVVEAFSDQRSALEIAMTHEAPAVLEAARARYAASQLDRELARLQKEAANEERARAKYEERLKQQKERERATDRRRIQRAARKC